MRFVVLVHPGKAYEAGAMPSAEQLTEMGNFNEELAKAGILLAAEGLHPTSKSTRLKFASGKASATDGPFTESKEIIGGFWIVEGKSKEEVVERFSHAPMEDGDMLDIRPIFEAEDFGDALTDEVREQEERIRSHVSSPSA